MTRFSYGASLSKVSKFFAQVSILRRSRHPISDAELRSRDRALAEAGVLVWETYPATSRVISRTNAVRLERKPFLREILGAGCLGVTSVQSISVRP
jgi:hypothetical protein